MVWMHVPGKGAQHGYWVCYGPEPGPPTSEARQPPTDAPWSDEQWQASHPPAQAAATNGDRWALQQWSARNRAKDCRWKAVLH